MKFSIISQNFFDVPFLNKNRLKKNNLLIKEIISLKPDFICAQEITFPMNRRAIELLLLQNGYQVFFKKNVLNITMGGLFFASKHPIISSEFKAFSNQGTLNSLQLADRFVSKGFQIIRVKLNNQDIYIINAHLTCLYKVSNQNQINTHNSQILELLNELKKIKYPLIIGGDMSESLVNSSVINTFLNTNNLTDLSKGLPPRVNVDNTNVIRANKIFNAKMTGGFYDFVFSSSEFARNLPKSKLILKQKFEVGGTFQHLSDHYGICTALDL